jgi:hypothetical protein
MKFLLPIVFLAFFVNDLKAQTDTMSLSGLYYFANVFLYNPSVSDSFSVQSIIVNKDTISEDLKTNGIEVDLRSFTLSEGDKVNIRVIYQHNFPPLIVNPQALMPPVKFKITKPKFNKESNELQWRVTGLPGDYPIIVEQFKWNGWRTIATVDPVDTVENNVYNVAIKPHSGKNLFRIKTINIKEEEVKSKELVYVPSNMDKVVIQNTKFETEIVMSGKAEYEIYDEANTLILSGYDRYIQIKELPAGKYLLFFDNQIIAFKKK